MAYSASSTLILSPIGVLGATHLAFRNHWVFSLLLFICVACFILTYIFKIGLYLRINLLMGVFIRAGSGFNMLVYIWYFCDPFVSIQIELMYVSRNTDNILYTRFNSPWRSVKISTSLSGAMQGWGIYFKRLIQPLK